MGTPKPSKRKRRVLLLASIAMSAVAVSSVAVAQQTPFEEMLNLPAGSEQRLANMECDKISKSNNKADLENDLKTIDAAIAEHAKSLSTAQSNYKFEVAKANDLDKALDKHLAERRGMAGPLTDIMNGLRPDKGMTEKSRSLDSQIETDATELDNAKTLRDKAEDKINYEQAWLNSSNFRELPACARARLDALNKAPSRPSAPPAPAHAAPTAPIRSGNAWTCAKDRVEYTEGGKTLPSTSSNDLVVGETTVGVPAYTDRSGSHPDFYPAARITFTPPKPRYAVGETVVLELNVEGGHGPDIMPGYPGYSQGGAFWFAKEIGGSNMMGGVDADDRGAICGDSGHEPCGDTRHTSVSFPFQPKAQQGVEVVGSQGFQIKIPPLKHPPGVVGLVLEASGQARSVGISWICRPQ